MVVRQTPTAGGRLDLLGVGSDGRLVVFELKRDTLKRDAVTQIIDYASDIDAMDQDKLHKHIQERSGNLKIQKIDNFANWFNDNKAESEQSLNSITPARLVLVGLGVEDTTERMVNYLASIGMDISLLTFHGFVNSDGKTLLARNLEVDNQSKRGASSSYQGKARFDELAQSQDIQELLDDVASMIRGQIKGDQSTYSSTRRNFNLDYSWHEETVSARVATLFIEIDEGKNSINVGFHPVAIWFAKKEFENCKNEGFEEGPSQLRNRNNVGEIDYEVKLPIRKMEDWNDRKDQLTTLTKKVWEAYNKAREKALSN